MLELFRFKGMGMSGQFRSNVWDPPLIIAQIVSMQTFFYLSLGWWIFFVDKIGVFDLSLQQLFEISDLGLSEDSGRSNVIAICLSSLTCALGLWQIVGRTKQCLDFSTTMLVFHFFACFAYNGHMPQTIWWWLSYLLSLILMTVLGEFLCMRSELKSIPVIGAKVDL